MWCTPHLDVLRLCYHLETPTTTKNAQRRNKRLVARGILCTIILILCTIIFILCTIILIILIVLILCTIILRKISQHLYFIIGQSNLLLCVVFVDLVATKLKQVSSTCQIGRVVSAGALPPEPPRATRSLPRRR